MSVSGDLATEMAKQMAHEVAFRPPLSPLEGFPPDRETPACAVHLRTQRATCVTLYSIGGVMISPFFGGSEKVEGVLRLATSANESGMEPDVNAPVYLCYDPLRLANSDAPSSFWTSFFLPRTGPNSENAEENGQETPEGANRSPNNSPTGDNRSSLRRLNDRPDIRVYAVCERLENFRRVSKAIISRLSVIVRLMMEDGICLPALEFTSIGGAEEFMEMLRNFVTLKHITSENKAATHYSVHTSKMGATIAAAVSSEMVGGNAPSPLHGTETAQRDGVSLVERLGLSDEGAIGGVSRLMQNARSTLKGLRERLQKGKEKRTSEMDDDYWTKIIMSTPATAEGDKRDGQQSPVVVQTQGDFNKGNEGEALTKELKDEENSSPVTEDDPVVVEDFVGHLEHVKGGGLRKYRRKSNPKRDRVKSPKERRASRKMSGGGSPVRDKVGNSVDNEANNGFVVLDDEGEVDEEEVERLYRDFQVASQTSKVELYDVLSQTDWNASFDANGAIPPELWDNLLNRIFDGGIAPSPPKLRADIWTYLFGFFEPGMSTSDKRTRYSQLQEEYLMMKRQWMSMTAKQEERNDSVKELKNHIHKDVMRADRDLDFFKEDMKESIDAGKRQFTVRTGFESVTVSNSLDTLFDVLMTYAMYNRNLGYVQGMCDILIPIVETVKDEVVAFWCFAHWMETLQTHFDNHQGGVHTKLFLLRQLVAKLIPDLHRFFETIGAKSYIFAFRWFVCMFKREMEYDSTKRLWEILFASRPRFGQHFILFFALAILYVYRMTIMAMKDPDDVFAFVSTVLPTMIRPDELLPRASILYKQYIALETVRTPPSVDVSRALSLAPASSTEKEASERSDRSDKNEETFSADEYDG